MTVEEKSGQSEGRAREGSLTETVGKVTLDLSKYPGEDLYCDGKAEDELLRITRDLSPVEYAKTIEEKASWPILYHLSKQRENIVEWIPLKKTDKVLEVGSGCGAITGALSRKAGTVTCVDLSKKRSKINAYRHGECENVTIRVGNFQDIEPDLDADYDLVCLIGVFEYGISYIGGERPFEDFLKILRAHVKPGGRIVIAIENRLGLKYFAGCQEDHLGTYYSGIENYAGGGGVRTFSRPGLQKIFDACGVTEEETHFYYPYPDYKFMTTLFSDKRLPGKGELSNNLRNFDRDRILLFDEKNAFDGMVEEGVFPLFANSYLVVLGPDFDVEYARYSNDRAPQFQICTEIVDIAGLEVEKERKESEELQSAGSRERNRVVRKRPLTEEAAEHVRGMAASGISLAERFEGGELAVNRCMLREVAGNAERAQEDGATGEGTADKDGAWECGSEEWPLAEFEFVRGVPLSELMDRALERGEKGLLEFQRLFQEYVRRIDYHSEMPVADFDLVFSNLMVDGDDWTLIDYEWTFGQAVETKELAFRAVYCYLLEDEKREEMLPLDWIMDELHVSPEEAEIYRQQEQDFQKYVTGQRLSMPQMRELIGKKVIKPWKVLANYQDAEQICRVQVYEDRGSGYKEEESYFVKDAYQTERDVELELKVSGDVKLLRIDPIMDSCVVKVREMTWNGERIPVERKKVLLLNGRSSGGETPSIVFATTDPNLGIDLGGLERKAENLLCASLEVTRLPMQTAEDLCKALAKHVRW